MPATLPADGLRPRVLFVCTHNSARSVLAEAVLRARHGSRYRAASAGTHPRGVHPQALAALAAAGLPLDGLASKSVAEATADGPPDVVVTVCDHAREACPYVPAGEHRHHGFADPSAASVEDQPAAFARTLGEVTAWVDATFGHPMLDAASPADDVAGLVAAAGLQPAVGMPPGTTTVGRIPGGLAGTVTVEPHGADGWLRSMAVASAWRGTGLGGALVAAAEREAARAGVRRVLLLTSTAPEFFSHLGYERVDAGSLPPPLRAHPQITTGCPSSAVLLGRSLVSPEAAPTSSVGRSA